MPDQPGPDTPDPDDLTDLSTPAAGLLQVPVRTRPPPHPDSARWWVAAWLLGLITLVIVGAIVAVGVGKLNAQTALQLIFPPVLSAVATVVGFYFGSHRADRR